MQGRKHNISIAGSHQRPNKSASSILQTQQPKPLEAHKLGMKADPFPGTVALQMVFNAY